MGNHYRQLNEQDRLLLTLLQAVLQRCNKFFHFHEM